MKIYIDDKLIADKLKQNKSEQNEEILYISKVEDRERILKGFDFRGISKIKQENIYFESHESFAYLHLLVPSEDLSDPKSVRMEIYFAEKTMLLFYEGKYSIVETLIEALLFEDEEIYTLEEIFYRLLNLLNTRYIVCLDEIEDKITDLEDTLVREEKINYVGKIGVLRKQLLILRRYYEGILTLMEDLEENRNGLFSDEALRLVHFQTQKAERLYHNVLNLRDYLTQVREAYQALLDIESNKVMKLFTVITAIFLPLNLLVGWYGMNLFMPEAAFRHTYLAVIFVSIAIVVGLITYFKRNRWF